MIKTLFMLESLDGKISTGDVDSLDFDLDLPVIEATKKGLHQYYELECQTDFWSFNTGRVMEKIGANGDFVRPSMEISFLILDNTHLTPKGILNLTKWVKELVILTENPHHPSLTMKIANLHVVYKEKMVLEEVLREVEKTYQIERLTIQSGGTLNGLFLRQHLIDFVHVVLAPILVGGKTVSSLIDGPSINQKEMLSELGELALLSCDVLEDSYLSLKYKVTNSLLNRA